MIHDTFAITINAICEHVFCFMQDVTDKKVSTTTTLLTVTLHTAMIRFQFDMKESYFVMCCTAVALVLRLLKCALKNKL